jgi:hypothetical protein
VTGNRIEVRIRGVWGDIVAEHAAASGYGDTADAAYVLKRHDEALGLNVGKED